jgi:hypothetical protein
MLLDIRRRTNQEQTYTADADRFVPDAELLSYLNQELAELWTKLVLNQGQPHYRSATTYSVVPPTALYALPADFWTVQEVTSTIGGVTGTLQPFMSSDRGNLTNPSLYTPLGPVQYRIQAGNIEFRPATQELTATLYYSPCQPRLVNTSDVFDGFNGYEEAAICGVCAIVMSKEESDPSFWLGRKMATYKTIDAASAHRDMSGTERVQDVANRMYGPGLGFGRGWW